MTARNSASVKAEALKRIRNLLSCVSCSSPFKDPVTAACGHVFCGSCFKTALKRRNPSCPACKRSIDQENSRRRDDCSSLVKIFSQVESSYEVEDVRSSGLESSSPKRNLVVETQEGEEDVNIVETDRDTFREAPQVKSLGSQERTPVAARNSKRKRQTIGDDSPAKENPVVSVQTGKTVAPMEVTEEDDGSVPLDLTMRMTDSQRIKSLQKRRRYAFPAVDPTLAIDLSVRCREVDLYDALKQQSARPPVKRSNVMMESKRYLYALDTVGTAEKAEKPKNKELILPRMSPRKPSKALERLAGQGKMSEGSESSEKILNKAMDELIAVEEGPPEISNVPTCKNPDADMLSDDDEDFFNLPMDDPVEKAATPKDTKKRHKDGNESSPPGSNKKIKMNASTELELLGSSPAKSPPAVITENGTTNLQEVEGGGESDSGGSDVLFQTPRSEPRTPRRKRGGTKSDRSASKPKNKTPKASPLKSIRQFKERLNETPKDFPLLCVSPPSGAVIAQALNQTSENFDPFSGDFDDIPVDLENGAPTAAQTENLAPPSNGHQNAADEYPKTPDKHAQSNNSASTRKSQESLGYDTPKSHSSKQMVPSTFAVVHTPPSHKKILGVSSSPGISPSKAPKKFVFCPTRLSSMQLTKLRQLCGMCGGRISREFSEDVTHLILTLENGHVPQTMKYLFAIAGKKWVVTFDWVEECLRQKKIVKEDPYETSNFPGCDVGVKRSRTAAEPLFKGYQFYVLGNLESSGASVSEWGNLLKKLGARVVTNEELVKKNVIIVGDSLDRNEDYQGWFHTRGTITVAWEWILDCVLSYAKLPLAKTHYLITKLTPEQFSELDLSKELLP